MPRLLRGLLADLSRRVDGENITVIYLTIIVTALTFIYLGVALVRPERF
jgi:hypothetical protein